MKKHRSLPLVLVCGILLILAVRGFGSAPSGGSLTLPGHDSAPAIAHDCATVIHLHNAAKHEVHVHIGHGPQVLIPAGESHVFHVTAGTHDLHIEHGQEHWLRPASVEACDSLHVEFTPHRWASHHVR